MGIAVLVPGVNWAQKNIGIVTPSDSVAVQAIAIQGPNNIVGSGQYTASLFPTFTNERSIIWSITSSGEYATIDSNGKVTAKAGALKNSVTIRAKSSARPSVFAEKTIVVSAGDTPSYGYLQSDGNCYLLVGGLTLYGGTLTVRGTLESSNGYLIGSLYSAQGKATIFGFYKSSAGKLKVGFGKLAYVDTGITPVADKVYRLECQFSSSQEASDAQFKLYDDETDTLLYTSQMGNCYINADISIFCYGYNKSGVGTPFTPNNSTFNAGKIYDLVIKDSNGSILRDLHPKDMNGTPSFFDEAQEVAYYNLGSGTLTLGND